MRQATKVLQRLVAGRYLPPPTVAATHVSVSTLRSASFKPLRISAASPSPLSLTPFSRIQARHNSNISAPATKIQTTAAFKPPAPSQQDQPAYQITFTCKPCTHRSSHRITKQGYHHGSILIQCPRCKNRHVVSDHLKIFTEEGGSLEEILKKHGNLVKKGRLGIREGEMVGNEWEQDIEFWEDGSTKLHSEVPK